MKERKDLRLGLAVSVTWKILQQFRVRQHHEHANGSFTPDAVSKNGVVESLRRTKN